MQDFRQLSGNVWASPQIDVAAVEEAARRGFAMIVNNRPEGESIDQTPGADIASAAQSAGMAYRAIPVTHAGFSTERIEQMVDALKAARGPVLAYCRSGTRSTLLWALAQAMEGHDPDAIAQSARAAGYDVSPVANALQQLSLEAR